MSGVRVILRTMQRRTWLKLGLVTATGLALVGGGLALRAPAWTPAGLTASGRAVFAGVAGAVLEGSLPEDGKARAVALAGWFQRLNESIAALPPHTQAELAQLLTVLGSAPGRWALAGLSTDWPDASVACPHIATSTAGVNQRSSKSASGPSCGTRKAVSDRLLSAAIPCSTASGSQLLRNITAAGLPVKAPSANNS